jgi:hypothetical protein
MSTAFNPAASAKQKRPANVRATGSAAPPDYTPLPAAPSDVYTLRSHAAQYGTGRRYGIKIRCLILHTTESEHFINTITYDMWRPETVSASAFAGPAGELSIGIADNDRPWTTGRWNDESLTLEIVGRAAWTADQWRARPAQLEAVVKWIVDNCQRHNLPAVWITAAEFTVGASRAGDPLRAGTARGVIDHRTANDAAIMLGHDRAKYSHTDVGPGLRSVIIEDLLPEARRRLNEPSIPPPPGDDVMTLFVVEAATGGYAPPTPLFADVGGMVTHVQAERWAAMGNPAATEQRTRNSCAALHFVGNPPVGFRNIWGNA